MNDSNIKNNHGKYVSTNLCSGYRPSIRYVTSDGNVIHTLVRIKIIIKRDIDRYKSFALMMFSDRTDSEIKVF